MVFARKTPLGSRPDCADPEEHQVSSKTAWFCGGRRRPKGHTDVHRGSEAAMREPGPRELFFLEVSLAGVPRARSGSRGLSKSVGWKWPGPSCSDSQRVYRGSCCQMLRPQSELGQRAFGSGLLTLLLTLQGTTLTCSPRTGPSLGVRASLLLSERTCVQTRWQGKSRSNEL